MSELKSTLHSKQLGCHLLGRKWWHSLPVKPGIDLRTNVESDDHSADYSGIIVIPLGCAYDKRISLALRSWANPIRRRPDAVLPEAVGFLFSAAVPSVATGEVLEAVSSSWLVIPLSRTRRY